MNAMAMYKVLTPLGIGVATSNEDLDNMLTFLNGVKASMGLEELPIKIEELGQVQDVKQIEDVDCQ